MINETKTEKILIIIKLRFDAKIMNYKVFRCTRWGQKIHVLDQTAWKKPATRTEKTCNKEQNKIKK